MFSYIHKLSSFLMIIILFAIAFTLSLLMTIQEAFVDSVDQDQTAQ